MIALTLAIGSNLLFIFIQSKGVQIISNWGVELRMHKGRTKSNLKNSWAGRGAIGRFPASKTQFLRFVDCYCAFWPHWYSISVVFVCACCFEAVVMFADAVAGCRRTTGPWILGSFRADLSCCSMFSWRLLQRIPRAGQDSGQLRCAEIKMFRREMFIIVYSASSMHCMDVFVIIL